MPLANKFPPKFSQNILYPAELNLDEIDMSTSPVGDQGYVGSYFDIEFPGYGPNQIPTLSYGKHAFYISINPTPSGFPPLKQNSRVLFEVKDALDSFDKRRVIFSDVTPVYSTSILKFLAYVWIKEDPLRTYSSIEEGSGEITIVGLVETSDPFWVNRYNVRERLSINLDMSVESVNDETGQTQTEYYLNNSPVIFKNPTKMRSGSGLFVTEIYNDLTSYLNITASNLQTYSGKVNSIITQYWLSGSTISENCDGDIPDGFTNTGSSNWKDFSEPSNWTLQNNEYEEEIHSDYARGINPKKEVWYHQVGFNDIPLNRTTCDNKNNKVKFRFKFYNQDMISALNILPLSGSNIEVGASSDFVLHYPGGDPDHPDYVDTEEEWMTWTGASLVTSGRVIYSTSNRVVFKSAAGEFSYKPASLSSRSGLEFDEKGNPKTQCDTCRDDPN